MVIGAEKQGECQTKWQLVFRKPIHHFMRNFVSYVGHYRLMSCAKKRWNLLALMMIACIFSVVDWHHRWAIQDLRLHFQPKLIPHKAIQAQWFQIVILEKKKKKQTILNILSIEIIAMDLKYLIKQKWNLEMIFLFQKKSGERSVYSIGKNRVLTINNRQWAHADMVSIWNGKYGFRCSLFWLLINNWKCFNLLFKRKHFSSTKQP